MPDALFNAAAIVSRALVFVLSVHGQLCTLFLVYTCTLRGIKSTSQTCVSGLAVIFFEEVRCGTTDFFHEDVFHTSAKKINT